MSKTKDFFEDNKLAKALGANDTGAFQAVYKNCFDIVTRSLRNMSAELPEAEEIYHASLLVLYEKAKQADFVLECKISTFLIAVARKKWLKKLEQEKRLSQKEQDYARMHENDQAEGLFSMEAIRTQEKKLKQLYEALDELGEPCKGLITAFYIEEKSMKEISEHFGYTNANNAKTQKHKCLKRLKKIFLNQL